MDDIPFADDYDPLEDHFDSDSALDDGGQDGGPDHDLNSDLSSQDDGSELSHSEDDEQHNSEDDQVQIHHHFVIFDSNGSDVSAAPSRTPSPHLADYDNESDIEDNSSRASNRSSVDDSQGSDEEPSSPDSLFVGQRGHFEEDDDASERIHILQEQALELTRRHAELAQIAHNLHRSVADRRAALQRRAELHQRAFGIPRPIIPRRRLFGDDGPGEGALDELVEMEVGANGRQANRTPGPARAPAVIDLTEVPDSPEDVVILPPPRNRRVAGGAPQQEFQPRNRNPRRPISHIRRTPSLARSDGSILGNAPLIDLTDMDDDTPADVNASAAPRRAPPNPPPRPIAYPRNQAHIDLVDLLDTEDGGRPLRAHANGFLNVVRNVRDGLPDFNLFHRLFGPGIEMQLMDPNFQAGGSPIAIPIPNPLAENAPNFNYRANGYNNGPPKPAHVPPPPAREGFSRATGEDLAFVCPSCEEELKYDPDEVERQSPPTKRARTRKDREEHHFWAVKECGHVYCKACYENRKASSKATHKTNFRQQEGRRVALCAVDNCASEVSTKTAWVGLFL